MKIIFNQHYDCGYYLDMSLTCNHNRFDEAILGSLGLLDALERDIGIGGKFLSITGRNIYYKKFIGEFINKHPGSFLEESYKNDPGGVAKEMLRYRDHLIFSGWKPEMNNISPKIDFIANLEKNYKVPPGVEDRWIRVLNKLQTIEKDSLNIKRIDLTEKPDTMHPFYGVLFDTLESKGINIRYVQPEYKIDPNSNLGKLKKLLLDPDTKSIELDENDKLTFQILWHRNDIDAAEFITSQLKHLPGATIINADNSIFDEIQNSFGKPVSGSVRNDSNSQVIQLFKLISALVVKPMNIGNYIAYLQVNIHPVPAKLRYQLLDKIIQTGGVENPEWNSVIDGFEFKDLKHKEESLHFLKIRDFEPDRLNTAEIIRLYRSLNSWINNRIILAESLDPRLIKQLLDLQGMCDALDKAICDLDREVITARDFITIQRDIYKPADILNYSAQEYSCPKVVSPANLLSAPKISIWLDFYNAEIKPGYLDFLNLAEIEKLSAHKLKIWSVTDQVKYTMDSYLKGILQPSERCILVVAEKNEDNPTMEHPLLSLLRAKVKNLSSFILRPSYQDPQALQNWGFHQSDHVMTKILSLPVKKKQYKIEKGDLIRRRPKESSSSIELMLQYPFDWVLRYAARVKPQNSYSLGDLETTMGKVAHKFIEVLVKEAGNDICEAKALMKDYHSRLDRIVRQYGVMLLLDESRFEYERFRIKLKAAVDELINIIELNNLKVLGIEVGLEETLVELKGQKVGGFIDMILQNNAGERIIFDLKWSRDDRKYSSKLRESRHIQLCIYKAMVEKAHQKNVAIVAYYMLSQAKLLTPKKLNGEFVIEIPGVKNEDEILAQVSNSIDYRREQFNAGIIEECEDEEVSELDFVKETELKNLLPIELAGKKKKKNFYSAYYALKGDII